jgi:DNA-directed RNA polymerase subunit E"
MLTEQGKCPRCGGPLSKDWKGYLIVMDYSRSKIAKKMDIDVNGKFALRVR